MSASAAVKALMPADIRAMKAKGPVVMLTAYDTPTARVADRHVDVILVGDSLGMVVHGLPSTLGVTMEMMILHAQAVMRGASRALVVVDMPFGSYEAGPEQAFASAARLLKETGAGAVKLEGGETMAPTIEFLTRRGVPVMAHVGLTPQAVNVIGGYRVVWRGAEAQQLERDCQAVAEAGAFAVVLEKMPEGLSRRISESLTIPTIGIGAGAGCDGQVLVVDDMLGLFPDFRPRFVKAYAELGRANDEAIATYAREVRQGLFPAPEHGFADQVTKEKGQ